MQIELFTSARSMRGEIALFWREPWDTTWRPNNFFFRAPNRITARGSTFGAISHGKTIWKSSTFTMRHRCKAASKGPDCFYGWMMGTIWSLKTDFKQTAKKLICRHRTGKTYTQYILWCLHSFYTRYLEGYHYQKLEGDPGQQNFLFSSAPLTKWSLDGWWFWNEVLDPMTFIKMRTV